LNFQLILLLHFVLFKKIYLKKGRESTFGYLYITVVVAADVTTLVGWLEGNTPHAFDHCQKFKQNIHEMGNWHGNNNNIVI